MTLDQYQKAILHYAFYPNVGQNLTYPLIGLAGEVGELCNKFKKVLRAGREIDDGDRDELIDELGDVLWYAAAVAKELGYDLSAVAQLNLEKLDQRRRRDLQKLKENRKDGAV
jgi:NTP pyrophosphatase (non-canonical NTP hydrolase)